MTDQEARDKLKSLMVGMKPNPNHYPIIDKWNRRIYNRHKFEVFDFIESLIDERIKENDKLS